jgi:hypothetical protein
VFRLRLAQTDGAERLGAEMTLIKRASLLGLTAALAFGGAVGSAVALSGAPASPSLVAGTLNLRGTIGVLSTPIACPPEAPAAATECRDRKETGRIQGLGSVSVTYVWSYGVGGSCPPTLAKPLAATGRLAVAGKGEFQFKLADGASCVDVEPVRNEPQSFTIVGGTGVYEGASGSGTVERAVSAGVGSETWTGTLSAPGVEFDVTPPTLSGPTSKTVRAPKGAKSVRVTYKVTARDNADSQVPVICAPRSGSRFRIGRTVVRCSATDSSANTANAAFRVTVRRTR